ncbi:MAG: hypothetical protein GQ570_03905 [Helicobacteraceae bacterium]|nr:hypothetical protein [Helicobacteraceae bacterium]
MAVTLGGIVLPDSLVWADRNSIPSVEQTRIRTLGGKQLIYANAIVRGQDITLVATQNTGWMTLAQINSLQSLAEVPGAEYTLVYGGATEQVVFRHDQAPALDLSPLIARTDPIAGDYYIGTIKLVTV